MPARATTIGLCMIVRDEAQVIQRCLDSVLPWIDHAVIEDTGSTDGTQEVVRRWLARAGVPGEVIDAPWHDFASNRTDVLARLRDHPTIDYALMIDAEDVLVCEDGFDIAAFKAAMTADAYDVEMRDGAVTFPRPRIFRNHLAFTFRGVLHPFVKTPAELRFSAAPAGCHMRAAGGGARRRDGETPRRDAALLAEALAGERDPRLIAHYVFHLARSCRTRGQREEALAHFRHRAELGFSQDEVFVSLREAARLMEELGHPADAVIRTYLQASDAHPARAEALHAASAFCRRIGRNEEGFQLAARGRAIALPSGGLFVEPAIYQLGLLDQLAVNGYWSGHYRQSLAACLDLSADPTCPADQRELYRVTAQSALEKLPREPSLGDAGRDGLDGQHPLASARALRSEIVGTPRVLVAILVKQKEPSLPFYLECLETLDYPKSSIALYIRTNNNTDRSEAILRDWVDRVQHLYAHVEFDAENVPESVETFGEHEWNPTRFRVLARIRDISLARTIERGCDFYFVADADNFVRPCTLRELVALNLPIVAPLMRVVIPGHCYSNYFCQVDDNGYFQTCDQFSWILNQWVRGVIEVPLVHCTYLIRADMVPEVRYADATGRYEFVVFADSARKAGIPQYLDNRQIYGYMSFGLGSDMYVADGVQRARLLLSGRVGLVD